VAYLPRDVIATALAAAYSQAGRHADFDFVVAGSARGPKSGLYNHGRLRNPRAALSNLVYSAR
jgi:hypothetical protein